MPEFKNVLLIGLTGVGLYIGYVYYNKNSKQSIEDKTPKGPVFTKTETTLGTAPKSTTPPPKDPVQNAGNLLIKAFGSTIPIKTTPPVSTSTLSSKVIEPPPPKLIDNIVKVSTLDLKKRVDMDITKNGKNGDMNPDLRDRSGGPVLASNNTVKINSSTLDRYQHPPPMPLEPIFKNKLIGGFPFK